MRKRANWTWEETLIAFRLYCRTPFGKLHQHNPDIIALALLLGRSPSAVAMKACNFASLDPVQQSRGIKGLRNRGRVEEEIWEQFHTDSEMIAAQAEDAYQQLTQKDDKASLSEQNSPSGPTEEMRKIRVRLVQAFFRSSVLVSYGSRCALTGIALPSLLNASHIIPWSVSPERRADPKNGICLNALHDRAFDRGLITFDQDLKLVLSSRIIKDKNNLVQQQMFERIEGKQLVLPSRFPPDIHALEYHRDHIFAS